MTTALRAGQITLAVVAGYAGSGKSEAGKLLASATGWAVLDKDTISRPMTESLLRALGETRTTATVPPTLSMPDLWNMRVS